MTTADESTKATPVLRTGDHGAEVAKLQEQLARLGYSVPADGVYGPQTEAAVRDAQRHAGISADGDAGPQTLLALSTLQSQGYRAPEGWAPPAHEHARHHDDGASGWAGGTKDERDESDAHEGADHDAHDDPPAVEEEREAPTDDGQDEEPVVEDEAPPEEPAAEDEPLPDDHDDPSPEGVDDD